MRTELLKPTANTDATSDQRSRRGYQLDDNQVTLLREFFLILEAWDAKGILSES